ncbi:hypothetical protein R1sor_017794 [Riccia sorocarpa]|uniref:Uncharacterized protein n=1 Tax=Riccia sorocarpa TaxID=122646 RepID=A0ABD3IAM7_9MARC
MASIQSSVCAASATLCPLGGSRLTARIPSPTWRSGPDSSLSWSIGLLAYFREQRNCFQDRFTWRSRVESASTQTGKESFFTRFRLVRREIPERDLYLQFCRSSMGLGWEDMATLGVSVSNKKGSSWMGSEKGSGDSKYNRERERRNGVVDTPLAAQLQQAWLQTQLPKRNVPKLDFLSPLPSSPDISVVRSSSSGHSFGHQSSPAISPDSHSGESWSPDDSGQGGTAHHRAVRSGIGESSEVSSRSDSGSYSAGRSSGNDLDAIYHAGPGVDSGVVDGDTTMDDPFLSYISDMLMEEDLCEKPCMFVECSAYQAVTRELAELIGDPAAANNLTYNKGFSHQQQQQQADDPDVNSWVDEVLNSHPSRYFEHEELHSRPLEASSDPTEQCREALGQCAVGGREEGEIGYGVSGVTDAGVISGVRASRDETAVLLEGCTYLDPDTPRLTPGLDYAQGKSGIDSLTELYPLLIRCAEAVAQDDVRQAHQLISRLRQGSGPAGDGGQRMVHYFVEALVARLSGTGGRLYAASISNRPNAIDMLKAYKLFVQCNPLPKLAHYFANKTIFDAVQNATAVHIVDFGILYGVQWPCLIHCLATRPGGPPRLRITGIDFPQPGFKSTERIEETGRRLAEKASSMGVEFEYQAIAGKWEQIQPSQLNLRKGEMLIVNSMFRLRNLLDETVMASSPRKMLLSKIHSLNPELFVTGIINAGYNTPFFLARVREAVNHFSALFDAIHSAVPPIPELRLIAEREILGREILSVVACEGVERLERAETFTQWQSRITNAGFKQQPLDPSTLDNAREILRPFHKDFGVMGHGGWMLSGWKDRVLHALTSWKP